MNKTVFITGATGFIGSNLAIYLAKLGYNIHALHRKNADISRIKHPNIQLFIGDITDKKSIKVAMKGCEGVFHVAAYAKQWNKDKNKFYDINYTGTVNVLEIAKELALKKVVFTSTVGVIGPSEKNELVNENTKRTVDFFFDYEKTKWMCEEKIKEFVQDGMDITIVSPTRVYGPGLLSESNGVTSMIKQYCNGKWHVLPGNGQRIGNYVFIEDVVKGHFLAYTNGLKGEKYILGGTDTSYKDFFIEIDKINGEKHFLIKVPAFIIMGIAKINMTIAHLSGKAPFITPASAKRFSYDWKVDCSKAKNEINYQPVLLSEGLRKTIDWLEGV